MKAGVLCSHACAFTLTCARHAGSEDATALKAVALSVQAIIGAVGVATQEEVRRRRGRGAGLRRVARRTT